MTTHIQHSIYTQTHTKRIYSHAHRINTNKHSEYTNIQNTHTHTQNTHAHIIYTCIQNIHTEYSHTYTLKKNTNKNARAHTQYRLRHTRTYINILQDKHDNNMHKQTCVHTHTPTCF